MDDDSDLRLTLCEYLEARDSSFLPLVTAAKPSVSSSPENMNSTLSLPTCDAAGPDGIEVLKVAKQLNPFSCVVVMTGYSSIETAIESIRRGAFDYLTKPFKLAEIEIVANRIVEYLVLVDDNKRCLRNWRSSAKGLPTIDSST